VYKVIGIVDSLVVNFTGFDDNWYFKFSIISIPQYQFHRSELLELDSLSENNSCFF
jgi:hypothetical protein